MNAGGVGYDRHFHRQMSGQIGNDVIVIDNARLDEALLIVQNAGDYRGAALVRRRMPIIGSRHRTRQHKFERLEKLGATALIRRKVVAALAGFPAIGDILPQMVVTARRKEPERTEQAATQWSKCRVVIGFFLAQQRIEILPRLPMPNLREPLEVIEPGPPSTAAAGRFMMWAT